MASSLPLDLHLNGWKSPLLQPYISVTLCCIPISKSFCGQRKATEEHDDVEDKMKY
jgi:hypothetical protein